MNRTNDPVLIWGAALNLIGWMTLLILDIIWQRHWVLVVFHGALVVIWAIILFELRLKPIQRIISHIRQQIEFAKLAKIRRARYEQFKRDYKTGLIPADEFEKEAKEVVK